MRFGEKHPVFGNRLYKYKSSIIATKPLGHNKGENLGDLWPSNDFLDKTLKANP